MRNNLKIYLAGKMSGLSFDDMNNWRVEIKELLNISSMFYKGNLDIVNPVDYYNFQTKLHQSEKEVHDYELKHVTTSDIIIVNLDGLCSSDGTKIELREAYVNNIPVIAFGNKNIYNDLHPWIKLYITRVEDNMNEIVDYIRDFYLA